MSGGLIVLDCVASSSSVFGYRALSGMEMSVDELGPGMEMSVDELGVDFINAFLFFLHGLLNSS